MVAVKACALAAVAFVTQVAAHGIIVATTVDGVTHSNFNPHAWNQDQKITAGWTTDNKDYGFVKPSTYANGDIICHKGATPGQLSIKLKACTTMHLQWTRYVPSHHGPVMHYMANAHGDHQKVDKFALKWNKIDQLGLIDPLHSWNTSASEPGGYWAADQLIMQGDRWDFTVPCSIAKGKYVVRAETIALHNAMIKDGAQHYPQCINIEVTEGGTNELLDGTVGTELYSPTDPGIGDLNIFSTNPILTNYVIPGPEIHQCGQKGYDQTPKPGSAPIWKGPQTAEVYGMQLNRQGEYETVGQVGVGGGGPDGVTYGNTPNSGTGNAPGTTSTTPTTSAPSASTTPSNLPGDNSTYHSTNTYDNKTPNKNSYDKNTPNKNSYNNNTPNESSYDNNTPNKNTDNTDKSIYGNQTPDQKTDSEATGYTADKTITKPTGYTTSTDNTVPVNTANLADASGDESVTGLLDTITKCVEKLRAKLVKTARRHARDVGKA